MLRDGLSEEPAFTCVCVCVLDGHHLLSLCSLQGTIHIEGKYIHNIEGKINYIKKTLAFSESITIV